MSKVLYERPEAFLLHKLGLVIWVSFTKPNFLPIRLRIGGKKLPFHPRFEIPVSNAGEMTVKVLTGGNGLRMQLRDFESGDPYFCSKAALLQLVVLPVGGVPGVHYGTGELESEDFAICMGIILISPGQCQSVRGALVFAPEGTQHVAQLVGVFTHRCEPV